MAKFLARDQNGFFQSVDVCRGPWVRRGEYFIIHNVVATLLDYCTSSRKFSQLAHSYSPGDAK
jgi:hypothetical protein